MRKNKRIPKWIIKSFNPGKEDEDYSFFVSTLAAFSFLGIICLFKVIPFEAIYIIIAIAFILVSAVVLVWFCRWLASKVKQLKVLREEGERVGEISKTEEDVQ